MSIAEVKAEIKAWERSFKEEYLRPPTVEDIRLHPHIAEKYKLYKRLSKEPQGKDNNARYGSNGSSTSSHKTSIVPKSIPVQTPEVSSTANPFSPRKRQARKAVDEELVLAHIPSSSKLSYHPSSWANMELSPPNSQPVQEPEFADDAPMNTLKKARKRLHGDPVTPTPHRGNKRIRTNVPTRAHRSPSLSSSSDESDDGNIANSSYVIETPVKPVAGGKNFKQLFEEITPARSNINFNAKGSGLMKRLERIQSGKRGADGIDFFSSRSVKGLNISNAPKPSRTNSTLASNNPPIKGDSGNIHEPLVGRKRSSSFVEPEDDPKAEALLDLIPPSPPQNKPPLPRVLSTANQRNKKAKLHDKKQDTSVTLSDTEDNDAVEVVETHPWILRKRHNPNGDQDLGEDNIIFRSYCPRNGFATSMNEVDDSVSEDAIEVDLPDDLHRVLSIRNSRAREQDEYEMVQAVLQGGTPKTGVKGEVWGVGEIEQTSHYTDGEDDWAGEGVPWEVAEL